MDAELNRAAALIEQLMIDPDAIERAAPGSYQRSRVITRFQDSYVALGRIRITDRLDELDGTREGGARVDTNGPATVRP